MRDLSNMDLHRVTTGQNKTNPGDQYGTFIIRLAPVPRLGLDERKAVCNATTSGKDEFLSVLIKEKGPRRMKTRTPNPHEVCKLLPLFFCDHEVALRLHRMDDDPSEPAEFQLLH